MNKCLFMKALLLNIGISTSICRNICASSEIFERELFQIFRKYDEFLRAEYGTDYMKYLTLEKWSTNGPVGVNFGEY